MRDMGDMNKVWEIKALKTKPGQEEAQKMLEKIAKHVQPIMRKHNWRVKLLSEFFPNNPALLGLNVGRGVAVKLRLRRPNREWDFLPFDQVLDTMLHELCHNAHGPHNASFYGLWDQLRKECEELICKGISGTGEGFDLPGRRLGGFSRQPPLSSLRQTSLSAAEKRAKLGSMLPSGPKRLGGDSSIMVALSPIQAAAMAAERRLQDEIWCASQSAEIVEDEESGSGVAEDPAHTGEVAESSMLRNDRKRSRESYTRRSSSFSNCPSDSNYVESSRDASTSGTMLDHESSSKRRPCNLSKKSSSHSSVGLAASVVDLTSDSSFTSIPDCEATDNLGEPAMWACGKCTLLNPPLAPVCKLCFSEKPKDFGSQCKMWSCKFCTLENSVKLDRCSACSEWRYSSGRPVSTPAPNVGT